MPRLRVELLIFLLVWFTHGLFIKQSDLVAYNLQQMGVEALVEHGTFALGLSEHPYLQPQGDVFLLDGKLHAAKQPGQFVLGALAYAPLKAAGMTYERNYVATSAWVTWLSSSVFAALTSAMLLYLLLRVWRLGWTPALFATGVFAFGTPAFAYAGVAHHDVIAMGLLFSAFVVFERQRIATRNVDDPLSDRSSLLQGALLGLTVFVSMLPALMVLALLVASGALSARLQRLHFLLAGFVAGALPLAWHNWKYFGSPFMQANAAGDYRDTFFDPSWGLFLTHLNDYFGTGPVSLPLYAPTAAVGFVGLIVLAARQRGDLRTPLSVACGAVLLHLSYILNIETIGHCQFGPRYLLPALPFLCFPLALVWSQGARTLRLALGAVAMFSVFVGLTGALTGTMLCHLRSWVPAVYWSSPQAWNVGDFPLRVPMATGLIATASAVALVSLLRRPGQD